MIVEKPSIDILPDFGCCCFFRCSLGKVFSQVDSSVVDTNDETFLKGECTCELVDGQTYMKPSFDSLSVVDRLTICCSTAPPAAWLLCWKTSPAGLKEKVTAPSRTFFYH